MGKIFFTKILKYLFFFNFLIIIFLSFFAEFFANEKPLLIIKNKKIFFPIFCEYNYGDFYSNNFQKKNSYRITKINDNEKFNVEINESLLNMTVDYSSSEFLKISKSSFVIFPLVKFSFNSIDKSHIPPSPPSKIHPLGTTPFGTDLFATILYSVRNIIFFAVTVSFLTLLISLILGITSGYFSGFLDFIFGRILELISSINLRFLLLILGIIGELKIHTLIIIWSFFKISYPTKIIRNKTNGLRESTFIKSAIMIGMSHKKIITKKILPNVIFQLPILFPFIVKNIIVSVSSLLFLTSINSDQFLIGELMNMTKNYFSQNLTLVTFGVLITIILGLIFSIEIIDEKIKSNKKTSNQTKLL